jgi:UDP-N-acetylmuramoylalanine--D-glutamate ligase
MLNKSIFTKKKILIYGLGKSGISSYFFLKKDNDIYLYDDKKINNKKINNFISKKNIKNLYVDFIVISPGIDTKNCSIKEYIKEHSNKLITDLDIFYLNYSQNKNIAITGTNGKSTTAKLLFDVLKYEKKDVRLIGNIGNPVLNEKKITKKTIFVIEASSYQIEYSKFFKANLAIILNISPDHLERHGSLRNYIRSKFKLLKKQTKDDYSFLDLSNRLIISEFKKTNIRSKVIDVKSVRYSSLLNKVKNEYFLTDGNKQNLSFIISILDTIKIKKKNLLKVINNFKPLKFRQEVVFKSKNITIINDSKSTSFSSSENILKTLNNVYWILGGMPKKGDMFSLSKKNCLNIKAYIVGKNRNFFINKIKDKVRYQNFRSIENALSQIILDLNSNKDKKKINILFSPAAASFDLYKNFEDRGLKFNKIINKLGFKNNVKY